MEGGVVEIYLKGWIENTKELKNAIAAVHELNENNTLGNA